jgi:hypothetical protein
MLLPLFDILPLRAILFQLLFIVLAIGIEAFVLQRYLGLGRKTTIQYAATANLLSTVVGWFILFVTEPLLDPDMRGQLISYIFFDLTSNQALLVGLAFVMFIGTFIVKLQSIAWLDMILGYKKPVEVEVRDKAKFRGRVQERPAFSDVPSRALAVLWANSASFAAITLILALRTFSQSDLIN